MPGHHLLEVQRLFRLDLDVGRGTAQAAGRLVHQDARVRQGETLAGSTRAQQELPHGRRQPHGHGRHVIADPLHGVVDRQFESTEPPGELMYR